MNTCVAKQTLRKNKDKAALISVFKWFYPLNNVYIYYSHEKQIKHFYLILFTWREFALQSQQ